MHFVTFNMQKHFFHLFFPEFRELLMSKSKIWQTNWAIKPLLIECLAQFYFFLRKIIIGVQKLIICAQVCQRQHTHTKKNKKSWRENNKNSFFSCMTNSSISCKYELNESTYSCLVFSFNKEPRNMSTKL